MYVHTSHGVGWESHLFYFAQQQLQSCVQLPPFAEHCRCIHISIRTYRNNTQLALSETTVCMVLSSFFPVFTTSETESQKVNQTHTSSLSTRKNKYMASNMCMLMIGTYPACLACTGSVAVALATCRVTFISTFTARHCRWL